MNKLVCIEKWGDRTHIILFSSWKGFSCPALLRARNNRPVMGNVNKYKSKSGHSSSRKLNKDFWWPLGKVYSSIKMVDQNMWLWVFLPSIVSGYSGKRLFITHVLVTLISSYIWEFPHIKKLLLFSNRLGQQLWTLHPSGNPQSEN